MLRFAGFSVALGVVVWLSFFGTGRSSQGAASVPASATMTIAGMITGAQERYRVLGIPTPSPGELGRPFRPTRLNLPTMMTRIGGYWFVVDSYNNRILYNDRVDTPIQQWRLLDGDLSRPHSIAGNGEYLVVDDTEAHSLRVYRREEDGYGLHQLFIDIGARPHRVWYESSSDRFYVLSANSQELSIYGVGRGGLEQIRKTQVRAIAGAYTRAFRIIDGSIWLYSANGMVSVVDPRKVDLPLIAQYRVPQPLANLNDMIRVGTTWYLSATRNHLAECELNRTADRGEFHCMDLQSEVPYKGNPYFFDKQNDALLLGIVAGRDAVFRLSLNQEGRLTSAATLLP